MENVEKNKQVVKIKIEDIIPNRFQPRIHFDEEALFELADSIKVHGIIQPLILRPLGAKYEIIAGERRYKAAQLVGLSEVPAIVETLDDQTSAELAIIENLQREGLSGLEEAKSYQKLLKIGNLTQEQLAKQMGKSQSTIANKLRLLNLCEEVQDALLNHKISERHARSILALKSEDQQKEMLHKIITERLTVKDTDEAIKKMQQEVKESPQNEPQEKNPVSKDTSNQEPLHRDIFDNITNPNHPKETPQTTNNKYFPSDFLTLKNEINTDPPIISKDKVIINDPDTIPLKSLDDTAKMPIIKDTEDTNHLELNNPADKKTIIENLLKSDNETLSDKLDKKYQEENDVENILFPSKKQTIKKSETKEIYPTIPKIDVVNINDLDNDNIDETINIQRERKEEPNMNNQLNNQIPSFDSLLKPEPAVTPASDPIGPEVPQIQIPAPTPAGNKFFPDLENESLNMNMGMPKPAETTSFNPFLSQSPQATINENPSTPLSTIPSSVTPITTPPIAPEQAPDLMSPPTNATVGASNNNFATSTSSTIPSTIPSVTPIQNQILEPTPASSGPMPLNTPDLPPLPPIGGTLPSSNPALSTPVEPTIPTNLPTPPAPNLNLSNSTPEPISPVPATPQVGALPPLPPIEPLPETKPSVAVPQPPTPVVDTPMMPPIEPSSPVPPQNPEIPTQGLEPSVPTPPSLPPIEPLPEINPTVATPQPPTPVVDTPMMPPIEPSSPVPPQTTEVPTQGLEPSVPTSPITNPNVTVTPTNNPPVNNLNGALTPIRDIINNVQKSGYTINTQEQDFTDKYQIIINIQK